MERKLRIAEFKRKFFSRLVELPRSAQGHYQKAVQATSLNRTYFNGAPGHESVRAGRNLAF